MRATAKLDRVGLAGLDATHTLPHRHDADFVAILLAEQRHRTFRDRIVDAHQAGRDRRILQDDLVRHLLDDLQLLSRHRLRVRNVEAQALGRDQRTFLGDVGAQHFAESLVQQMGRGMVGAQTRAPVVIDRQHDGIADLDCSFRNLGDVNEEAFALLLGIANTKLAVVA